MVIILIVSCLLVPLEARTGFLENGIHGDDLSGSPMHEENEIPGMEVRGGWDVEEDRVKQDSISFEPSNSEGYNLNVGRDVIQNRNDTGEEEVDLVPAGFRAQQNSGVRIRSNRDDVLQDNNGNCEEVIDRGPGQLSAQFSSRGQKRSKRDDVADFNRNSNGRDKAVVREEAEFEPNQEVSEMSDFVLNRWRNVCRNITQSGAGTSRRGQRYFARFCANVLSQRRASIGAEDQGQSRSD